MIESESGRVNRPMTALSQLHRRALCGLLLALSAAACTSKEAAQSPAAATESEAQLMERGMQQLYQANDPVAAEATFRAVLAKNQTHYGAHYQLAVALDRGGKPDEARPVWNEVLRLAQSFNDTGVVKTSLARLGAPDTASQAGLMARGLDLMYAKNDPVGAIAQFQAVIARNRTHYGANYQLAVALDRAGRAAEAKQVWQRVLPMAIQFKDQKTIDTARARLR
jgi:Tfp pilus assembly protein PilF